MASNQPFKKKKLEYNVDQSTVDKILKKTKLFLEFLLLELEI